jgi:NAD-dependent protein deacetylase/lipoamidase
MPAVQAFDALAADLKSARHVAVLTGAGVSAESGVPTFRGAGGLWEGFRIDEVATPEAFARDPRRVWEFYEARRRAVRAACPNPAHRALAAMEGIFDDFLLATQNVDGLHARAGSRRIVELHGSLSRSRCMVCGTCAEGLEPFLTLPPACGSCGGLLRPDVVWFGELLPLEAWRAAESAAQRAEVFLVVGTSAEVYPAAGLALFAAGSGAAVYEINPEATALPIGLAGAIRAPAGQILPKILASLARS